MKKTLIALLALGSVAMADEPITVNASWAQQLTSTMPTSTTVTPTETTKGALTISDWTGTYINDGADPVALTLQSTTGRYGSSHLVAAQVLEAGRSTDVVTYSFTLTNNSDDSITLGSFATSIYACSAGGDAQGSGRGGSLTLTIGGTTANAVNFSAPAGSPTTATVDFTDVTLNAGESTTVSLAFKNNAGSRWFLGLGDANWTGSVTYSNPTPDPVPEPATGSLTLLALAGLAARRRRK